MSVQLDAAFNYNDLQGLETLKSGARKDNPEALKAVAQQFESMFLSLIMKSMRDATDVMASDLENSYQTKFYRDMHDEQLTLSLSQNGGFGLAEILYEQLMESQKPTRFNPFDIDVKGLEHSNRPVLPFTQLNDETQSLIDKLTEALPASNGGVALSKTLQSEDLQEAFGSFSKNVSEALSEPNSLVNTNSKAGKSALFETPVEFIKSLMPLAEKAAKVLGLDPKFMLAQAALETGWGKHVIEHEDGQSSFNFFGIKADQRWHGSAAMTTTHEFVSGKRLTVKEPFRAYQNAEQSFNDYVDFVQNSDRYQNAVAAANTPEEYVKHLQSAGYATDPNYAEKIIRIANSDWFEKA